MSADAKTVDFEALDSCHREIHVRLGQLAALAQRMEAVPPDAADRAQAAAIEAFFSGTSREHHALEERDVFPPLLGGADAQLEAAVRLLQQDHGWIEEDWLALAPQLRALAEGDNGVDIAEFLHNVDVFVPLCRGHIALEESLVYPESKARWAQAIAERVTRRSRARPHGSAQPAM
jgi:hemerythrin-like domain-containing protein